MDLIVGNSIVKYWGEEMGRNTRVFCLPGAKLDEILEKAIREHRRTDRYVYLQSGIPDLHRKWEHSGILPERLDLYKRNLRKVHQHLPKAIILLIYPPLNAPHGVCEQYYELNKIIIELNRFKTPNTISRIFHRDHNNKWRVECARLSDGIHPTREEVVCMVRRLEDEVETVVSKSYSKPTERTAPYRGDRKRPREEDSSKQEKPDKLMVTIEGSSSSSEKIERLLLRKKRKLEDLKAEFARREKEIEDQCVEDMRRILEVEERPKTASSSSRSSTGSSVQTSKEEEETQEEFMVLDEWRPGTRDIRTDVPRRVHFC